MIYVVDDDASVRRALQNLFASMGLAATAFGSTEEFLGASRAEVPSCLVLDIRLPGVGGLEFQEDLARRGLRIPIVFITAHGDIPMTARAMKAGAVEFLTKPLQRDGLLAAVQEAIERDRRARASAQGLATLQARFATLSGREREVMALVTAGHGNKQIAAQLGIAEITVKVHRRQAMLKMRAGSLAELVRMAAQLEPKVVPEHGP
jgi:FixJ family two-component response regulator